VHAANGLGPTGGPGAQHISFQKQGSGGSATSQVVEQAAPHYTAANYHSIGGISHHFCTSSLPMV
jgi:hypothetical protein